MNVLQALFCNQYEELVKTGRDGNKARKNGLILSAVCLTLNILTAFFLLFKADLSGAGWLRDAALNMGGKATGEILGVILFCTLWVILRYTIGTENYFQQLIERFNTLGESDKRIVNRKAYIYCFGSIIILIVCIFI